MIPHFVTAPGRVRVPQIALPALRDLECALQDCETCTQQVADALCPRPSTDPTARLPGDSSRRDRQRH